MKKSKLHKYYKYIYSIYFAITGKKIINITHEQINNIIHRGDIIGIEGFMGKSRKGELSIFVKELKLLTPSLHTLTKENFGIQDIDTRISKRYLDLQINNFNSILFQKSNQLEISRELTEKLQLDLKKQKFKTKFVSGIGIIAIIGTVLLIN